MKRQSNFKKWLKEWDSGNFDFTEAAERPFDKQPNTPEKSGESAPWRYDTLPKMESIGRKIYQKIYPVFAVLLAAAIVTFLFMTVLELPAFGSASAPTNNIVSERYIEKGLEETGAINIVAGVILDYRAFDTLGESHVLYTAVTAVLILLLAAAGEGESEKEKKIMTKDPILRKTAAVIVPMVLVFGIYVLLNGHLGPGGGFSGGSLIGGGLILYSIAFGYERLEKVLNMKTFRIICMCALCFYSLSKCYSFFCGANHLETIFKNGTPGAILSAGLILPLNVAVGIVVACTMYGIWSVFQRGKI